MSCLALYRPQVEDVSEEPAILPFPRLRISRADATESLPIRRARQLFENRCCPDCRSAAVDPIELNDALLNAQLRPIAGTATIVAFHCHRCHYEWPVH